MVKFVYSMVVALAVTASPLLWAQPDASWLIHPPAPALPGSAAEDLPAEPLLGHHAYRPRLSVSLLEPGSPQQTSAGHYSSGWFNQRFFWSMDALHSGTERAHIHCERGSFSANAYLAEDCRFVIQPAAEPSLDLMQLRGQWLATPGLSVGVGVFRGSGGPDLLGGPRVTAGVPEPWFNPRLQAEGMDVNISLGVEAGRVGDLLFDLQLARYRDYVLEDHGAVPWPAAGDWYQGDQRLYQNAAQISLGWRRGDFSGGILGNYRESRRFFPAGSPGFGSLSSFDIELSWRAPWNASFSIGASNVLDAHPSLEGRPEAVMGDDAVERVYGRIPYVRYKQDL